MFQSLTTFISLLILVNILLIADWTCWTQKQNWKESSISGRAAGTSMRVLSSFLFWKILRSYHFIPVLFCSTWVSKTSLSSMRNGSAQEMHLVVEWHCLLFWCRYTNSVFQEDLSHTHALIGFECSIELRCFLCVWNSFKHEWSAIQCTFLNSLHHPHCQISDL